MERLTDELVYPLDNFHRCQRCGFESEDICRFRFWTECDENDNPEPDKVFLLCRGQCRQDLEEHPRLYIEVPWGGGSPGHFTFTCEECSFRQGTGCSHPDLKSNGGEGLEVMVGSPIFAPSTIVCFNDGRPPWRPPMQARECKGFSPFRESSRGTSRDIEPR